MSDAAAVSDEVVPAQPALTQPVPARPETRSLLELMLAEARIKPEDETYEVARRGIHAFVAEMLESGRGGERVDKVLVDAMIAQVDKRLSAQINCILHQPEFQALEGTWRTLRYLIENVDFRENIRVSLLSVSKEALLEDFEDSPDIVKSGLYRHVYSAEFGTFGGKPFGVLCGNYEFDAGPGDMQLLQSIAAVCAMSHAPFLSNASARMFGCESYPELAKLKDLQSLFEGPQYARWHGFRESEDSRYVGLCAPRFLLRQPYGADSYPIKEFNFEEEVIGDHDAYLWGYTAVALCARVAESFAKYRWCPNIVGPMAGGAVTNLPLHQYEAMGEIETKCPTEVQLTDRRELEMSEQGFIGLTFRKESNRAAFFSANSCQKPKLFASTPEGKAAETNYRLGTQLPYMFVISRLSHYLKVMQREQIGTWKERGELERQLNLWINQYVVDMETPAPSVRSRKPLRSAQIDVEDVEGQPGWYRCSLKVRPHFKYMGVSFTLSLVGKLDKG